MTHSVDQSERHSGLAFRKGHGTGNDFVIVDSVAKNLDLSTEEVARICDRHMGIGADGVLRIARASEFGVADVGYFMDYRNADGSIGATCGNGLRVFARALIEAGYESRGSFKIGTRAGVVTATVAPHDANFAAVSISMGLVTPLDASDVSVKTETGEWAANTIASPNPHAVVIVNNVNDAGTLLAKPVITPADTFIDGANVEFIEPVNDTHIKMRTHERGVGETLSCGSGSCAAAFVWAGQNGLHGQPWKVQVDVLGGTVHVESDADGLVTMSGPAAIVADGVISKDLLAGVIR